MFLGIDACYRRAVIGRNSTTMHKERGSRFVDMRAWRRHSTNVLNLARRFLALTTISAMMIGSSGICVGWTASADDRRACCVEETGCPKHEVPMHHPHASTGVTQAQADACCAATESRRSSPTTPHLTRTASVSLAPSALSLIVDQPAAPFLCTRTAPARPPGTVPRHLLLSVLLV